MGQECCAGDIFKKLYQQYGQTFVKLMVAQKGKDVIRDEFGNVKTQAQSTFQGFNSHVTSLVDGKIGEVTKIYEDVKSKVNGDLLYIVENQQGKSVDQISGFNNIKNQIVSIKTQAFNKIDEQRNTVLTTMNKTQDDMVTNIEKERPKIQVYEQLPDPLKRVVREYAETEFSKQLAENKDQIINVITKKFGPQILKQIFAQISPESILNNIVGGAGTQLTNQLTRALGFGGFTGGNLFGGFGL